MHVAEQLTENVEIGAIRIDGQDNLEVVTTDGGLEVRNSRGDEPRRWEIAIPIVNIESDDTADYDSVREMWLDTERGLHTFNFNCFVEDTVFKVRFDSPLNITAPAPHLR
jgi:ligand-binding sensor domain-containing protein